MMATNRKKISNYIKESSNKPLKREFYLKSGTMIFIKDAPSENLDLLDCFKKIEHVLPNNFLKLIDVVYVGQFEHLDKTDTNAMFKDSAIYVTNLQDDNDDFIDDIIHEVAHAVGQKFDYELLYDERVELEFLGKREKLEKTLRLEGYNTELFYFLDTDYSRELDKFFYQEVGYPMMTTLTMNLFVSPYGATSLKEYFANGFEAYYLDNRRFLEQISPKLYQKITYLENLGD
jgi:hypothetical protein